MDNKKDGYNEKRRVHDKEILTELLQESNKEWAMQNFEKGNVYFLQWDMLCYMTKKKVMFSTWEIPKFKNFCDDWKWRYLLYKTLLDFLQDTHKL